MRCPKAWMYLTGLLGLVAGLDPAFGKSGNIPIEKQASVLLKALSYDRNLTKRIGKQVRLAVLCGKAEQERSAAAEMAGAFARGGQGKVGKLPIEVEVVSFQSVGQLLQMVKKEKVNAFYLHESADFALASVLQVSRGTHTPSMGSCKDLVERGISLGVYLKEDKVRLAINKRNAAIEKIDFDPAIVLIATEIH